LARTHYQLELVLVAVVVVAEEASRRQTIERQQLGEEEDVCHLLLGKVAKLVRSVQYESHGPLDNSLWRVAEAAGYGVHDLLFVSSGPAGSLAPFTW
jgi:hypothetical protein